MDCEWVEAGGQRQPVALLQLASHTGVCVLVQLAAFTTPLPASLQVLNPFTTKMDSIEMKE